MDEAELKKMKVVDLRAELEKQGLDSSGLKAALVQRLLESQKTSGAKRSLETETEDDGPQEKKVKVDEEEATDGNAATEEPEQKVIDSSERYEGTCKWFNMTKGFGFITSPEGKDIFVHRSNIKNAKNTAGLATDEPVEYGLKEEKGRVKACEVTGPGGVEVKGVFDRSSLDYKNPETFPQPTTSELAEGKFRGVCKWFNSQKGFGFITPSDETDDIFVHQTALLVAKDQPSRTILTGEHVEYELDTDDSGRRKAKNVTGPAGAPVIGEPQQRPVLPYPPMGYQQQAYGGYGGYGGYRR